MQHGCADTRGSKAEFPPEWKYPKVGNVTPRKIIVDGKEKEIPLPIIAGHGFTKEDLIKELTEAGFKIIDIQRKTTRPHGTCWIVVSQKP